MQDINAPEQLLANVAGDQPYPLLFATISGAHLYGFASPDSDYDLRGVHILPLREVIGLHEPRETISVESFEHGMELDLVTHDVKKFFSLLLRRNGYVLEQLYSPLVVRTGAEHQELKEIARGCITRHHAHHYFGFARKQWELFYKEHPRRIKPLLYVFRVLLTGIDMMRTGRVEANLTVLNQEFGLPYIPELIERKMATHERSTLDDPDVEFFRREYERLITVLEESSAHSQLPETASAREALNDLLIRCRMER